MVNRNGSNIGNSNGHKPDAAIVGEHDPASSAGRQGLRLPRRPRRHRPGQPHIRLCAASRGIGYLTQLGRIRRKFLGQPTHLDAKA